MHAFTTVVTLVLSALAVALPAELQERASTQYTDTVRRRLSTDHSLNNLTIGIVR